MEISSSISTLPNELLYGILLNALDQGTPLNIIACVSKLWNDLVKSNSFWKDKTLELRARNPQLLTPLPSNSKKWKGIFLSEVKRKELLKNPIESLKNDPELNKDEYFMMGALITAEADMKNTMEGKNALRRISVWTADKDKSDPDNLKLSKYFQSFLPEHKPRHLQNFGLIVGNQNLSGIVTNDLVNSNSFWKSKTIEFRARNPQLLTPLPSNSENWKSIFLSEVKRKELLKNPIESLKKDPELNKDEYFMMGTLIAAEEDMKNTNEGKDALRMIAVWTADKGKSDPEKLKLSKYFKSFLPENNPNHLQRFDFLRLETIASYTK